MNRFTRFTALRWMYNVIVPPRYRDKLNITEELCAFESALNKVIAVTNANGKALEAISQDLEDIQFGVGGYYRPAITENEDGSVTFSFVASDDNMPPIEEKTFFLGDMQSITKMLQGFNGDPMEVKNYIDEMSGGYYTPVFEQDGNTVEVSFVASNKMLPALDGYSFTLPSGPSGKSAYEIAVDNGFKGSVEDFFASLKGEPYTLTEADIATIVQKVIENLGGQPVAGYIDEDNNLVITSALQEGTYSLKLEMTDGTYDLGTITVNTTATYTITWVVDGKTYTDTVEEGDVPVFSGSTDKESDGQYIYTFEGWSPSVVAATANATYTAVYRQTPVATSPTNYANPSDPLWMVDQRLATSYGYGKSCAGHILTNFVPAKMGDVIYVTGLDFTGTASSYGGSVSAFKGLPADSSNTSVQNVYQSAFAYTGIHESHDHAAKNCVTREGDAYVYTILMGEDGQNRANAETTHIRIDGIPVAGKDVVIQVKRNGTWL